MNKREIGKKGEEIASKFLENNGIQLIKKNYFSKYGEIDLIGIANKTIIFIEVKLRKNKDFGLPYEAINSKKIQCIRKSAEKFIQENDFSDFDFRFDVISIVEVKKHDLYEIEWLKSQYFD
jgi:putative endonuclease